jgi:hypothetical protein
MFEDQVFLAEKGHLDGSEATECVPLNYYKKKLLLI